MNIEHDTLNLERKLTASPERVFAAYIDPAVREKWCVPSDDMDLKIIESNVVAGGTEIGRCSPHGFDDYFEMRVRYHAVEEPNHIIFSEELWEKDQLLTIALITFDIRSADDGGSILHLTDQITSFAGKELIDGHKEGYSIALGKLETFWD